MTSLTPLPRLVLLFLALAGLVFLLPACSGDGDDDTGDPGGGGDEDTAAPFVVSIIPEDESLIFDLLQMFEVQFNEEMDPDSVVGNITLSQGTITNFSWMNPSILLIEHNGLPEASEITLTIGTGVMDLAGNGLASAYTATYTTIASQLALVGISPDDGDVDVNRNTNIGLGFTEPAGGLEGGVTISDGNRTNYAFEVTGDDMGNHTLNPVEDFPAETLITVTVSVGVYGQYTGSSLDADESFSFTTGTEVDNTPPTIVGIMPSSGSTIPVDQGTIMVEFDEPVNLDNFSPPYMNGQFVWAFNEAGMEPELSPDGTELTVYLPAVLPPGLSLDLVLAGYEDEFGNVQTSETEWAVTVAGTATPYYLEDGYRWTASGTEEEGELGNPTPIHTYDSYRFYEIRERSGANMWEYAEYDWEFSQQDFYDILSVTSSGVSLVGIGEDQGAGFQEYFLSSPVLFFDLPFEVGNTWSGSASITLPDGTLNALVEGEVISQGDLEYGTMDGTTVVWTDAWLVEREVTISQGGEVLEWDETEFWFVPGIGIVRESYYEEDYDPDDSGWIRFDAWRDLGDEDR